MAKINRELLPIKAHYFFFFAALGPLLSQMNVYGRQLGVSPESMGLVTAVLPLLWAVAKPCFGCIVDYFTNQRKFIFMLLVAVMSGSYCGLWFLPKPASLTPSALERVHHLNDTVYLRAIQDIYLSYNSTVGDAITPNLDKMESLMNNDYVMNDYYNDKNEINNDTVKNSFDNGDFEKLLTVDGALMVINKYICHWECRPEEHFVIWMSNKEYINEMYVNSTLNDRTCKDYGMDFVEFVSYVKCKVKYDHNLMCIRDDTSSETLVNKALNDSRTDSLRKDAIGPKNENDLKTELNLVYVNTSIKDNRTKNKGTELDTAAVLEQNVEGNVENGTKPTENVPSNESSSSVYGTVTFWGFVLLMTIGTVAFNVANCISDAVCFDILGPERGSLYGGQRAWGTAGYGITALLGGWLVDRASCGVWKDFTPAFILAAAFTLLDLFSCRRLRLPKLSGGGEGWGELRAVLLCPRVLVFIAFAVVVGALDSFIIYYMFWYAEELAEAAAMSANVKLLEGVVVFGQSFVGELLFFFLSGRILTKFGYGHTMTFCLLSYAVRLALISLVTNPWYLVPVEAVMQGPTYALCYSCIVGYAASVAPEGHSATVQGVVAGMDDGLGFALGSLVGGRLYGALGGAGAFRVVAALAAAAALLHARLHSTVLARAEQRSAAAGDAALPQEADKMLGGTPADTIYCDTVVPLRPTPDRTDRV